MMRWLLTYADMITLLMVFFIVLYAMSQVDKMRYEVLMKALKQVLTGQQVETAQGGAIVEPPPVIAKSPAPSAIEQKKLLQVAQQIRQAAQAAGLKPDVSVSVQEVGVRVSFLNGILYNLGSANIRPQAMPLLQRISQILATVPNNVVVQGYTDDIPIDNAVFHTNWDLSAIRATRVVEFMVGEHLDPIRFAAEAYSKYHPIASNQTATGRQQNRRVDLVILRGQPQETLQQLQQEYGLGVGQ